MNRKFSIKIDKLFTISDINLSFNNNLNIIVGENGCGKSTVLKLINNSINNNFIELVKTPFDAIELKIGEEIIAIKHQELEQTEMSKNPEFRIAVRDSLKVAKTVDEFINLVVEKSKNFNSYQCTFNDKDYALEPAKYLIDDNNKYGIKSYIKKMEGCKSVFGSIYYLRQVFNAYHNLESRLVDFNLPRDSFFYSFIDLDDEFYNFKNVSIANKIKVLHILKKFMPNKIFRIKNGLLKVYNSNNKMLIECGKLSSGEKKLIQFHKSVNSLHSKSLLLLDEPELSLSYLWSENLLNILKSYSKKSKIIIATQQPQITNQEDLELLVPIL